MSFTAILFTALGALLTVPYVYLRTKKRLLPGLFIKVVIAILFILTAAAGILFGETDLRLGAAIFIGLIFGLLGDIFLDQKDMYAPHKETYVFAGFISFLTGHMFFITGMLSVYSPSWQALLLRVGIALAAAVGSMLMAKPLKMNYGRFKWITAIYAFLLTLMACVAFACYGAEKTPQALWMGVGGILFLVSDLVLSQIYFGKAEGKSAYYVVNYALYAAAQFVIALSLSV